jgi:hypothetical protein
MYPIAHYSPDSSFERDVQVGCLCLPGKGEEPQEFTEVTRIFRASDKKSGTAEMIGYHIGGRVVNDELVYYQYAPKLVHINHLKLSCPCTILVSDDRYEWGWSRCTRVFPYFSITIENVNQSWYPGYGSITDASWCSKDSYITFDSAPRYYPNVIGDKHSIFTSRDQKMRSIADFPTWSEGRCWEYLMYIYSDTSRWRTADFSIDYYSMCGDSKAKPPTSMYIPKASVLGQRVIIDPVTPPRFGEQIINRHVICQPDKLSLWRAYSAAIENLPTDDMNWIEGIVDAVNFIVDLVTLNLADLSIDLAKMPKYAANVWLTWRYVYNTTKADVEDISSTRSRVAALTDQLRKGNKIMTTHGEGSSPWGTCHVSLTYAIADVLELNNFVEYTERMLAYDAWDLIPFSFIVDWFYSVGDLLHDISIHNTAMKLHAQSAWYSYSYTDTTGGGQCKRYFRRRLNYVPGIPDDVSYVVDRNGDTRALKRSIDSLSILVSSIF